MKSEIILTFAVLATMGLSFSIVTPVVAQGSAESRYSNIGLKLNLGFGTQDVPASQNLEKGDAVALRLGYGVSQRVTLWLGADLSRHQHELNPTLESDLVGFEFGLQYKLQPFQKLRPYGKIGLGTFFLGTEATDTVLNGGGVTWALGAEYRLMRFFSIGAEFFWKDFDYTRYRIGKDNDFVKIENPILGNTKGFMLNFTIQ
ncbi:MAG: porin family protein [candidate division KSB1 bacterium]|nr:porin family protein [candidate division KSB1 bacterium]MDZ7302897.1 porin family protein [candidate division KSB1 bacterium]MDZ7310472.1 porin family protein [candidate division KSB1 bacterium]